MKLAGAYPIRVLCQLLAVPRSSVYYQGHALPDAEAMAEAMFKAALLDLAGEWPTYGYRRLTAMMRRDGWPVNGKRVRPLDGGTPHQRSSTQADPTHHQQPALAVLMDVFTRTIRGWHLGRDLDQGLTLAALERALVVAVPEIHHSDQGVQYAATDYVERLQACGVTLSMATIGEPRENGYAERLMRTIKEEEVYLSDYQDFPDAQRHITRFLDDVYNIKRIHSALGYLTPKEFEDQWRANSPPATTTMTGAEDRATLASDPSADSGGNGMGRRATPPPSLSFLSHESAKRTVTESETGRVANMN